MKTAIYFNITIPGGCSMHPVTGVCLVASKLIIIELPSNYQWGISSWWGSNIFIFIFISYSLPDKVFDTCTGFQLSRYCAWPGKWCSALYYIVLTSCLIEVNIRASLPFLDDNHTNECQHTPTNAQLESTVLKMSLFENRDVNTSNTYLTPCFVSAGQWHSWILYSVHMDGQLVAPLAIFRPWVRVISYT